MDISIPGDVCIQWKQLKNLATIYCSLFSNYGRYVPITIVPVIIGALEFIFLYMVELYRTLIPLLQKTALLGTAIILAKVLFN